MSGLSPGLEKGLSAPLHAALCLGMLEELSVCVSEVCTDPFCSVEVLPSVCLARVALEAAASLVCALRM